jgi:uncharacterized protein (DUF302 family)
MNNWRINTRLKVAAVFSGGAMLGMIIMLATVLSLTPRMILKTHESCYGVDETCQRLKQSIKKSGMNCPAIRNLNKSMAKGGVEMKSQVRIVEFCKADYARDILITDPALSAFMPCAFGVYEKNGKIFVTSMNAGLIGNLFGGKIAEVMGQKVSSDEKSILKCLN